MRSSLQIVVFGVLWLSPALGLAQGLPPPPPPPPVGPVAPQVDTADTLQSALTSITLPPIEVAWTRMSPMARERTLGDLKSVLDRIREQAGLPVGPVAPMPVLPVTPPATPPTPPPPSPKEEFDQVLKSITAALEAIDQKQPNATVIEGARLRQLLAQLKGAP